jgi:hypothetical protein
VEKVPVPFCGAVFFMFERPFYPAQIFAPSFKPSKHAEKPFVKRVCETFFVVCAVLRRKETVRTATEEDVERVAKMWLVQQKIVLSHLRMAINILFRFFIEAGLYQDNLLRPEVA